MTPTRTKRFPVDYPRRKPGWQIAFDTAAICSHLLDDLDCFYGTIYGRFTAIQLPCHDDYLGATWS